MIRQGNIWWADLPEPRGSEPGYRWPVVVVQDDSFNRSSLRTVVCLSLTANLRLADVLGNVVVPATLPGLPRDSVAVVLQPLTVDKADLLERVSLLPRATLDLILSGIEIVLQEMRCVRPTRQRGTRASARFQGGRLTAGQREPAVTQLL